MSEHEPTTESIDALRQQLTESEHHLAEARKELATARTRFEVDRQLLGRGVVDLEAARLLAESAIGEAEEPDIAAAVEELAEKRPYLFQRVQMPAGGVMGPRITHTRPPVAEAAERANQTGSRRALLDYLRLRRATPCTD